LGDEKASFWWLPQSYPQTLLDIIPTKNNGALSTQAKHSKTAVELKRQQLCKKDLFK
jgi:hypothetical protein